MTSDDSYSYKYVIYSHYAFEDKNDYEMWKNTDKRQQQQKIHELKGFKALSERLPQLKELLNATGHEGMLVLFYAPEYSFSNMLDALSNHELPVDESHNPVPKEGSPLRFARDVAAEVESELKREGLIERVRIISPLDLWPLLSRASWNRVKDIRYWFIGREKVLHYDTSKIVEAIVRLRLLGAGMPVFRIDHDVLFNHDNEEQKALALSSQLSSAFEAYHARRDHAGVATFLFSVGYDSEALADGQFDSWSRAFATRVYPAILVDKKKICDTNRRKPSGDDKPKWTEYCQAVFDVEIARKYYGLDQNNMSAQPPSGISMLGAHPHNAVISGALLCLSTAAIVDLPPFSNFSINVMWIDDHLKYCLHRELRHLFRIPNEVDQKLRHARIDGVYVTKARPAIDDLPSYVLGDYLPTLLWGSVVDRWITPFALLKYRSEQLSEGDQVKRNKVRRPDALKGEHKSSSLPEALAKALECGEITRLEKNALKTDLETLAIERINEIRRTWRGLKTPNQHTFASLWATGNLETALEKDYGIDTSKLKSKSHRWHGIAPGIDANADLQNVNDLNPALITELMKLIDDAVDYIEWTLNWPTIIQLVRSVEQGTMKVDIRWKPEEDRNAAYDGS